MKVFVSIIFLFLLLNSCTGLKLAQLDFTDSKLAYNSQLELAKGLVEPNRKKINFIASGYNIHLQEIEMEFTEDNITEILEKRFLEKSKEIKIDGLSVNIRVFEETYYRNKIRTYLCKKDENSTYFISFSSEEYKDLEFEANFVNTISKFGISESLLYESKPKNIDILGFNVEVIPSCFWRRPLSLQCPRNGQANWSFHKNLDDAKYYLNLQKSQTEQHNFYYKEFKSDTVSAFFLGEKIELEKREYFITPPISDDIDANSMIVYYVAKKINDKFIHMVLSHYDNDNTYLIDQILEFE